MLNQDPKISIIIPVFNGEVFIEPAYDNILQQHLQSFEIIFVNNNSTDRSQEIIESLIAKDSRITVYHENLQGAGAARNLGIDKSKGSYLHFFDVDDRLFDGALNTLKTILDEHREIDSVFGKGIKDYSDSKSFFKSDEDTDSLIFNEAPSWGLAWMNNKISIPGTPSFLHRNRVFKQFGLFPNNLKLGEDAFFHIKLGLKAKVCFIDRHIFIYNRHQNSTVSKQNAREPQKIFTYWPQYIHAYLPYILTEEVPLEFKKEVYKRLYGGFAKMIALTSGLSSRISLKRRLLIEIRPLHLPFILHFFIQLLLLTGWYTIYKIYFYYVLPVYLKLLKE